METELVTHSCSEQSKQEQNKLFAEDTLCTKKCPFCAEQIQVEAVKCRYCGEFLEENRKSKAETKWHLSMSSIVIAFLFVGPLALPFVWFHPRYKTTTKITVTVIVSVITVSVIWLLIKLVPGILEYYSQLGALMKELGGK